VSPYQLDSSMLALAMEFSRSVSDERAIAREGIAEVRRSESSHPQDRTVCHTGFRGRPTAFHPLAG
jgi:hypothetical protein